jgi:hypothetical protein
MKNPKRKNSQKRNEILTRIIKENCKYDAD